jgi:rhodanese-related sulfurtransferase
VLFGGVNVPSKAFGEFVEHHSLTPSVSPEELKSMMDQGERMVVLDSRPWIEYRRMNIPTGIDCPGAELALRVHDIVDDPETTVVVNCAGRTRSIIGAQSLINAGIPNRVVALRNGTMGWALAGFQLEQGSARKFPDSSIRGLEVAKAAAARVAERFGVTTIDRAALARWQAEAGRRTLFLLDVRNPEEYEAGHMPGSISAPGGQLVQATDRYVGTMRARLALIDDTGVRATMTASWLIQMGWTDVVVLQGALDGALETGWPQPVIPGLDDIRLPEVDAAMLKSMLDDGAATAVDLATSLDYRDGGHIPGAWWAIRARLDAALGKIPGDGPLVFTSPDGVLARLAAGDAATLTRRPVSLLAGGTASWRAAGLPLATGFENLTDIYNDDILYRAYDYTENVEEHMKEYLSWETGLVQQIERDGTARFRHVPVR